MAFPNFHGRRGENAGNFLDDLEMAFLVSRREDEEIKLRAFPLVLREEAKVWFQDLDMDKQGNWEALKRAFLLRYSGDNNPEEIWRKLSKLQQASPDSYSEYETQFLELWTQWENSLPEGERAPNFLQKERFLARLTPILREKVKCKFPGSCKEALTWARLKDRKLQFQRSWRDHSQAASSVTTQKQVHPLLPNGSGDPYLDRLRRVTKQLDSLSINLIHGLQPEQPVQQQAGGRGPNNEVPRRPPRREYQCHNYGEDEHAAIAMAGASLIRSGGILCMLLLVAIAALGCAASDVSTCTNNAKVTVVVKGKIEVEVPAGATEQLMLTALGSSVRFLNTVTGELSEVVELVPGFLYVVQDALGDIVNAVVVLAGSLLGGALHLPCPAF
ncbi:hypothetical protein L7F22_035654 [Adiantum nelumboides]|nr:hypothetical protein [Adiantum nelumboides]